MKKLFAFITLLTLIACQKEVLQPSTLSTQISNDAKTTQIIPFEFLSFNNCTQEWVLFTGQYEIDFRQTINNNGIHHGSQLQHRNTLGIGQTTGKEYKIIGQANDSGNYSDDAFNFSIHARLTFATQGAKNDWVVAYKVQVVTNDNGIAVIKSDFAEFCK